MTPADLDFLCALVRARSGLVVGGERAFIVETRLGPLARREKLASISDLIALLREEPMGALARAAIEAMTVQETSFFRDRQAFGALGAVVLPTLAAGKSRLRVWSAGCGKGQEAYSLAMMAEEGGFGSADVEILATDLSTAALDKAQTGIYSHFEVQRGLPIRSLLDHFEEADEAWRARAALRQRVRWMRLNLIDPFSVGERYDLILCRHVVSGFSPDARAEVLMKLDRALAPGGRLMLGAGEAPVADYVPCPGAPCVFQRAAEMPAQSDAA